jgi:pyruvate/2-oxoglutarate/acetoin dehydrogenase E1 component
MTAPGDTAAAQTTAEVTYSSAYQQGMREEMSRNGDVFVLGTDLYDRGGHFGQVQNLGPEFGSARIRDTPISEAAMVAAGVGAAMNGARPVVDLNFMDFAYGAMDEIVNQAAKMRYMWGRPVPLVIRATAGVAQGGAQHNNSLQSWFMNTPGLAVVMPSTPRDTKGLIKSALRGDDPVIFMMHKRLTGLRGPVGDAEELIPIGVARLVRQGRDLSLITYGLGVILAERAEPTLRAQGIDMEIIDLRSLAPLDIDAVTESVRRTGRALVLDEAPPLAGPADAVVSAIQQAAFWYLDQPVVRLTARHCPIPHAPVLMDAVLPAVEDIVSAALALARADGPQELTA